MIARHYPDPTRTNNNLANLSWATPLTNGRDMVLHGTSKQGIKSHFAKLTDADVLAIRSIKHWPYGMVKTLAEKHQVRRLTISLIRHQKTWKHLTTDAPPVGRR
jgi:hypothetical protein